MMKHQDTRATSVMTASPLSMVEAVTATSSKVGQSLDSDMCSLRTSSPLDVSSISVTLDLIKSGTNNIKHIASPCLR